MASPPQKRSRTAASGHSPPPPPSITTSTTTSSSSRSSFPTASRFERSFMHAGPVAAVACSDALPQGAAQGFFISAGKAGEVKFWRKLTPTVFMSHSGHSGHSQEAESEGPVDDEQRRKLGQQAEFAKHFQAHDLRRCGFIYLATSQALDGGTRAVTAGGDGVLCVFDVANFDMSAQLALDRVCVAPVQIVGRNATWVALAGLPRNVVGLPSSSFLRSDQAEEGTAAAERSDGNGVAPASAEGRGGAGDDLARVDGEVSPGAIALYDITGTRTASAAPSGTAVQPADAGEEIVASALSGPTSAASQSADTRSSAASDARRLQYARPFRTLQLHTCPVVCLAYNPVFDVCVSADTGGALACFAVSEAADAVDPSESCFPSKIFIGDSTTRTASAELSELDFPAMFYCFVKARTFCVAMAFSADGTKLVAVGHDRKVRVFDFLRGKLLKTYDETLEFYQKQQKRLSDSTDERATARALEPMEFGRRVSVEKEIDKRWLGWRDWLHGGCRPDVPIPPQPPQLTVRFDATGRYLAYCCLLGIKVIDVVRNKVFAMLGRADANLRFNDFAFYQPTTVPGTETNVEAFTTTETTSRDLLRLRMGGASGVVSANAVKAHHDPTVICTAFRKNRIYLITTREPLTTSPDKNGIQPAVPFITTLEDRDIFNEAPPPEETSTLRSQKQSRLAHTAVIHTTMGDIRVKLFWEDVPKTVENFTQLARRGYYNNLIFHRVIVNFMIQTGDPTGTGMGGESAFPGGKAFEDEIRLPKLKHERYTLSMANAGPNTNGSQFFITAVPCPSLDGKHTVFGRVSAGQDVVHRIERVKVDADDRPVDDVRMVSVSTTLVGSKEI